MTTWKLRTTNLPVEETLQKTLNIHPVFCRILAQRGISTHEEARRFFRPSLQMLHDPFLMVGMDKAVERIQQAIQKKEKILIYGDYDADGVTSVALMHAFLEPLGAQLDYYLPDRFEEGYGISMKGIDYAKGQHCALMIALDCGIQAIAQAKYAQELGVDMIICDHHLPGDELPAALAILNPKQAHCPYPNKDLCGCAVGFKLAQGYAQKMALDESTYLPLLDLVAVSLACDIVPLTGENRVLAHFGMAVLNSEPRMGLRALVAAALRGEILSVSDVVFGVGPLLNAAGRLAHASEAVRLLLCEEEGQARSLAQNLARRNRERRDLEQRATREALALVEKDPQHTKKSSVVLHQPQWHKGIVGIVAARVAARFNCPAIIFGGHGDFVTGSARSALGFDLHSAIEECKELLENFGGHSHAAGMTIAVAKMPLFAAKFEEVAARKTREGGLQSELVIDAELPLSAVNPSFWNILKQFGPFGPGNMRPVFMAAEVRNAGSVLLKKEHIHLRVEQESAPVVEGMAFFRKDVWPKVNAGQTFDLCFALEEDQWKGQQRLRIEAKDFRFGDAPSPK